MYLLRSERSDDDHPRRWREVFAASRFKSLTLEAVEVWCLLIDRAHSLLKSWNDQLFYDFRFRLTVIQIVYTISAREIMLHDLRRINDMCTCGLRVYTMLYIFILRSLLTIQCCVHMYLCNSWTTSPNFELRVQLAAASFNWFSRRCRRKNCNCLKILWD